MSGSKRKRRPQPQGKPRVGPKAAGGGDTEAGSAKPAAPVVLRASGAKRLYSGLFGAAFFVVIALNAAAPAKGRLATVPLLLVVGCCLVCVRLFRVAVVADERGVVVRNMMRTYRLGWQDVQEIRLDPPVSRIDGWEVALVRGPTKRSPSPTKTIRLDAIRRTVHRDPAREKAELEPVYRQLRAWERYARAARGAQE